MARLIAFDQNTAAALRRQLPQHQIFEHGATDVADYLVGGPETLVAVLPVGAPGETGVAVFRRARLERAPVEPPEANATSTHSEEILAKPSLQPLPQETAGRSLDPSDTVAELRQSSLLRTRAGGFLGLRDEAVFEEEQKPTQKRNWWARFWDEE
jgi:hypothetical protein